ncbi:MAG: hypothetical protein KAJ30_02835 [Candidatus Heimdallarchaeota archaeon]|nr:hypothetical protein [Candidatus Heimdallarchaeota archaeon]
MSYLRKEVEAEAIIEDEMEKRGGSKKVLFVGLAQTGKTSIIHVVFSGRKPEDIQNIPPTINFTKQIKQFSNMNIYVYDVSDQTTLLEQALGTSENLMFSDLNYLFFVVDAANPWENESARDYFLWALRNTRELNKNISIRILVHKMDLIPDESKEIIIQQVAEIFNMKEFEDIEISGTSIYDSSLFDVMKETLV